MSTNTIPGEPNPATASSEPLVSVGLVSGLVTAAIALLVSFGLHIGDDQKVAILGFVGALAPLAAALWGRGKVWSPLSVARALAAARAANPPSAAPPLS